MRFLCKGPQYIHGDMCASLLPMPGVGRSGSIAGQIPTILPKVSFIHLATLPSFLQGEQNKILFIASRIEEILGS